MTFTIDSVYKRSTPRGDFLHESVVNINTTTSTALTITPTSSPSYAYLINEVRFKDASFITGAGGSGLMQIEHPDYVGTTTNTITYNVLEPYITSIVEVNSQTWWVMELKPPVLLKDSSNVSSMTVGLPTGVTVASGDIDILVKGWKIKETDYD